MKVSEVTVTTGIGKIFIVLFPKSTHPFKSPVRVYVMVEVGLTVTIDPVTALMAVSVAQK